MKSRYRGIIQDPIGVGRYLRYGTTELPPPNGPGDSFTLTRMNIEPGQIVEIDVMKNDSWMFGACFQPEHFVFVGSPDLWILKSSNIRAHAIFGVDTPCDSFRPGCPTDVNWMMFSCTGSNILNLSVQNRAREGVGNFIARLAGRFVEP